MLTEQEPDIESAKTVWICCPHVPPEPLDEPTANHVVAITSALSHYSYHNHNGGLVYEEFKSKL